MNDAELDDALALAMDAARQAGVLIRAAATQRIVVTVKSGVDLVTETDKACEDLITALIKQRFPTHGFVGEETTFATGCAEAVPDGPTWFVDPLDGTTNFVHSYPFVTVSIGLAFNGVPVMGVIYNPIMDELFSAAVGKGAFLNGRPIRVSDATAVGHAMIMNNIGASRDAAFARKTLNRIEVLLEHKVQAVRNSGSAAQNMAHVACGKLDVYYEDGYGGPWDVAAGIIIVKEAGGVVCLPEGGEYTLVMGKGKIMCGPKDVCDDVARVLNTADARPSAKAVLSCAASPVCCSATPAVTVAAVVGIALGIAIGLLAKRRL